SRDRGPTPPRPRPVYVGEGSPPVGKGGDRDSGCFLAVVVRPGVPAAGLDRVGATEQPDARRPFSVLPGEAARARPFRVRTGPGGRPGARFFPGDPADILP